jgi:hypothetical protein
VRHEHCSRGRLPWEPICKQSDYPKKRLCKKKVETIREEYRRHDCDVLKRPKRNTYEWVIEEEKPCKPFGIKTIVDKTVCEIRRMQKCIRLFGDTSKCQNLTPDCTRVKKVYPMKEAVQKGSLPGCARPLPASYKKSVKK